jgi:pimeloyl-ACP methyl ester carboxylesterase
MPHITSRDGTRIGYHTVGSGPLIVAVAGATQYRAIDPKGMPGLSETMASEFTTLIYDRRGRGESTDTWPYAVAREVEDIEALIDAHGASAYLFGMSSGAVLALEAAVALKDKVRRVVMYEPPIDPAKSSSDYRADHKTMAKLAAEERGEDMMAEFMSAVMPPEAVADFRQSPAWPAFAAVGLTIEHDYRVLADARASDRPPERWQGLETPVLILDGDASFPFMRAGADWVASGIPNVTRMTLAGQSHDFDPKVVGPEVARFFRQR